jgi:hypothetical protein
LESGAFDRDEDGSEEGDEDGEEGSGDGEVDVEDVRDVTGKIFPPSPLVV